MKNFTTIGMTLTGIWTALSGILELTPAAIGSPAHHVFAAFVFLVFLGIHTWLNRRSLLLRFKGLGWKWSIVGMGLLVIILTTVAHPRY